MSSSDATRLRPPRHRKSRRPHATAASASAAPYAKPLSPSELAGNNNAAAAAPRPASPPVPLASNLSTVRFRDFVERGRIGAQLIGSIPFEFCTQVQAQTLDVILDGEDVLARAKTGTGKTLAFLIPVIQQLVSPSFSLPSPPNISALVLAPTRELAQQIEKEARNILPGTLGVQCFVGGTNVKTDVQRMQQNQSDIVIATPGRFLDLIETYGLDAKLRSIKFLVLDEADRLLDAGFKREIERIIQSLPDRNSTPRQTLLFSATIPQEVHTVAQMALLPTHKYISTVSSEDTATHTHVKQHSLSVASTETYPVLARLLAQWTKEDSRAKAMVFANTARSAGVMAQMFAELAPPLAVPLFTIHSRLSQSARTRATTGFTEAKSAVLFTSDVTARGIDVPGVTHVVQVGMPSSVEQYIHRLGRTARAGQTGTGLLILAPYENFFLLSKEIKTLSLEPWSDVAAETEARTWRKMVEKAMDNVDKAAKEQAYQAWLGFYKGSLRQMRWTEQQLVDEAAAYARHVLRYKGADAERNDGYSGVRAGGPAGWKPPPLMSRTVGKMGLKGGKVLGLNVVRELPGSVSKSGGGNGRTAGVRGVGGSGDRAV